MLSSAIISKRKKAMSKNLNDVIETRRSGKFCKHCGEELLEENLIGDIWVLSDCSCDGAMAEKAATEEELTRRLEYNKWMEARSRIERFIAGAGIPTLYRRCTKPSTYLPPNDAAAMEAVKKFINAGETDGECDKPWLYIYGTYGSGKTSLACAILYHVIFKRYRDASKKKKRLNAVFTTTNSLIRDIQSTFGKSDTETETSFKKYSLADILVLDNFASLAVSDYRADTFFDILNERYNEERLTIFTTTCPPENLVKKLTTNSGNSDNAKSIESRVCEHSAFIKMEDKDFRKA